MERNLCSNENEQTICNIVLSERNEFKIIRNESVEKMFLVVLNIRQESEKQPKVNLLNHEGGFPYGGFLYDHENDHLEKYTLSH